MVLFYLHALSSFTRSADSLRGQWKSEYPGTWINQLVADGQKKDDQNRRSAFMALAYARHYIPLQL
jgi:hypothetical protein